MATKTYTLEVQRKGFKAVQKAQDKINDSIGEARKKATSTGKSFSGMGSKLKKAGEVGAVGVAAITTAAVAATAALAGIVSKTAEYAKNVDTAAKNSGIASSTIQEVAYAAEQVSGASMESVADGFKEFSLRAQEAAEGTGEAQEAFQRLGISQQQIKNSTPDELFARVQKRMKGLTAQQRILTSEQLFGGEAGEKLSETMGLTAKQMNQLSTEARRSGNVLSSQQIDKLEKSREAYNKVKKGVQGFGKQITVALLPVIQKTANFINNKLIPFTNKLLSDFQSGKGIIGSLSDAFKKGFRKIKSVFNGVVSDLQRIWDEWGGLIIRNLENTLELLFSVIKRGGNILAGAWDVITGVLTGNWKEAFEGIKRIIKNALLIVVEIVATKLQIVLDFFAKVLGKIPGVGDSMKEGLSNASDAVNDFTSDLTGTEEQAEDTLSAVEKLSQQFSANGGLFGGDDADGTRGTEEEEEEEPTNNRQTSNGSQDRGSRALGVKKVQPASPTVSIQRNAGNTPLPGEENIRRQNAALRAQEAVKKRLYENTMRLRTGIMSMTGALTETLVKTKSLKQGFKAFGKEALSQVSDIASTIRKDLVDKAFSALLNNLLNVVSLGTGSTIAGIFGSIFGGGKSTSGLALAGNKSMMTPRDYSKQTFGIDVNVSGTLRGDGRDITATLNKTTRTQRRKGRR